MFLFSFCLLVRFTADGTYRIPASLELDDVLRYLQELPAQEPPELFGLHQNAELTFLAKESRAFMGCVVDVQPREAPKTADSADPVVAAAKDFLARMPAEIDKSRANPETYKLADNGTITSLGTVASQEIDRYNALIRSLTRSLQKLVAAIRGEVAMDPELEATHGAISFFQVPKAWEKAAYPSLRPLMSWFSDFVARVEFFRDWNDTGLPSSFWLGGFFFPQGFLTGVLQTHSRQFLVPIDTLTFICHPTDATDPDEASLELLNAGVYVHGLHLEGASWSAQRHCFAEPRPRELIAKVPILWLEPTTVTEAKAHAATEPMYECPIYKVSTRAGTLSTTGVSSSFILAVHLPSGDAAPQHWTKRGAAMITTLDD